MLGEFGWNEKESLLYLILLFLFQFLINFQFYRLKAIDKKYISSHLSSWWLALIQSDSSLLLNSNKIWNLNSPLISSSLDYILTTLNINSKTHLNVK